MPEGLLRRWIDPEPIHAPEDFSRAVGGYPLAADILYRRGIRSLEAARAFLDPDSYTPAPPETLPGVPAAAQRIERAIQAGEPVCVWGDFDVDGQTSTALLVEALRDLGAQVSFHIPVRASESHGINLPHLKPILDSGVKLLVTCDTGINAHEALSLAHEMHVDAIITDHHALGETLPPACAVVSPQLLPAGHPLESLPGVGVAYALAEYLYRRAGRPGEAGKYLDLAALGIVADVAALNGDCRYLLQKGLAALRETRRAGLRVMLELNALHAQWLTEEHIGFILAPRLNALGRLDDANPAVELLTTADEGRARLLATQLEGLNAQRRRLTSEVLKSALAQIERDRALLDFPALVLSHPDWPAGVVGIVASALAEKYNRPAVLIAAPVGEAARGSARAVEGIQITQAIAQCASLLRSFGGHPMAAGLSIDAEKIAAFRRALGKAVEQQTGGTISRPVLAIAAEATLADLTPEFVDSLERLAPFGPGNPPPALALRNVVVSSTSLIGRGSEHEQIIVEDDSGQSLKVVWWNGADWPQPEGRVDLACVARASNYRGQRSVQVEFIDARPVETEAIRLRPAFEVIDQRGVAHPLAVLLELVKQGDCAVWAEGEARIAGALDRNQLNPAATLAVWTTPPGRAELLACVERVKPQRLLVFAVDPADAAPDAFLRRLAGLCKYAMEKLGGEVEVARLAGASAQREEAVKAGLKWLELRGMLRVEWLEGGRVRLCPGGAAGKPAAAMQQVKALTAETQAFRAWFQTASKNSLI